MILEGIHQCSLFNTTVSPHQTDPDLAWKWKNIVAIGVHWLSKTSIVSRHIGVQLVLYILRLISRIHVAYATKVLITNRTGNVTGRFTLENSDSCAVLVEKAIQEGTDTCSISG
mmetsp:Transcript_14302/g.28136  ORF Transcript_14302/g.28136 Transcript_14302/m.28136 type:complete len:114 (-) Transcript_14302:195-536(-)